MIDEPQVFDQGPPCDECGLTGMHGMACTRRVNVLPPTEDVSPTTFETLPCGCQIEVRYIVTAEGVASGLLSGTRVNLRMRWCRTHLHAHINEMRMRRAVELIELWVTGGPTQAGLPQLVYDARDELCKGVECP